MGHIDHGQEDSRGDRPGLRAGRRLSRRHARLLLGAPFLAVSGVEKWPFPVNADGLGTTLSFYFKRIKSEPDSQLETGGKSPVLRELAARGRRGLLGAGCLVCVHLPHTHPSSSKPLLKGPPAPFCAPSKPPRPHPRPVLWFLLSSPLSALLLLQITKQTSASLVM